MSAHIAMASKICFASLAGVLVAASVVAVVRMAMRHGTNPAVSWRHTSASTRGNVERLAKPGGGLVRVRERERTGDFIADPASGPQPNLEVWRWLVREP